jgi:uncharacterized protein YabN with tetrapyrrole methylase and pyrophosphatase domain
MSPLNRNWLTVAGIGYQAAGHVTTETLGWLQSADRLFFLVYDPIAEQWLRALNPSAVSLSDCARPRQPLSDCCRQMEKIILEALRQGRNVCAVFSGHPSVGVDVAHHTLEKAGAEGYPVRMVPAVSAMDCLFADLGVEPADGFQIFEAETLMIDDYRIDKQSALIILQPGTMGITRVHVKPRNPRSRIIDLQMFLLKTYQADHEVVVYEAAMLPIARPRIDSTTLARLIEVELTPISTLYIPPAGRKRRTSTGFQRSAARPPNDRSHERDTR